MIETGLKWLKRMLTTSLVHRSVLFCDCSYCRGLEKKNVISVEQGWEGDRVRKHGVHLGQFKDLAEVVGRLTYVFQGQCSNGKTEFH